MLRRVVKSPHLYTVRHRLPISVKWGVDDSRMAESGSLSLVSLCALSNKSQQHIQNMIVIIFFLNLMFRKMFYSYYSIRRFYYIIHIYNWVIYIVNSGDVRVYLFPPHAVWLFKHSTARTVDVQGIFLSIDCSVDVQGVSINSPCSVDVQGVSQRRSIWCIHLRR